MRVLMLAQFYAPIVGGEERMTESLAVALSRRGHDVAVATLRQVGQEPYEERDGVARLEGQYFRACIDPSDRYVTSAKGTIEHRLPADGSGFANLTLTGDWIDNGSLNLGCVESTVIAGLQAAEAVTGYSVLTKR